jgi:hydrogenase nickel incorporation protein HypA/HybF
VHEVGIAERVLRIVEQTMEEHGLTVARTVVMEIGKLSGVDREALEFAFEVVAPDTVLAGAEIQIVVPPILLGCRACSREYSAEIEDTRCPFCGSVDFDVLQGRELVVKSVAGESGT